MEIYRIHLFKKEYKTFFKSLENITLRCYKCPYIPRFYLDFANDILFFECNNCFNSTRRKVEIIYYAKNILNVHQCQCINCPAKDDLYFSKECDSIICGKCKSKLPKKDLEEIKYISYDTIDKNCIQHLKKYEFSNNLCEDCLLNKNKELDIFYSGYENPSYPMKIKDIKNFILSDKEVADLKSDLNYIENYMNSINFPRYFENQRKEEKVLLIYLYLSFIRSLIYTFEQMKEKKYLNYNIIFNIRRIKINKNLIQDFLGKNYNKIPFYNVVMNKLFIEEKYKNEIDDSYFEEKNLNFIIRNEMHFNNDLLTYDSFFCTGNDCYTTSFSELIIGIIKYYSGIQAKIFNSNFNELFPVKGFHFSENEILNFMNYTFQVVDDYILIQKYSFQKYSVNNFGITFSEYQKIDLKNILKNDITENNHFINYDLNSEKVYFFLMSEGLVIILEKEKRADKKKKKYKDFFNMKIFTPKNKDDIVKDRNIFGIFDNKLYIFKNKKKIIEINLDTAESRNLDVQNEIIMNFLNLDNDYILLLILENNDDKKDSDLKTQYFALVNKKNFIIEKKISLGKRKVEYSLRKINDNQILSGRDIWYYLSKEKDFIKINYIDNYFHFAENIKKFFVKNGKLYYIYEECQNFDKHIYLWNLYEVNNGNNFKKESKQFRGGRDDFIFKPSLKEFERYNILKKKNSDLPILPFDSFIQILWRI